MGTNQKQAPVNFIKEFRLHGLLMLSKDNTMTIYSITKFLKPSWICSPTEPACRQAGYNS
jgi:hypothetical protein